MTILALDPGPEKTAWVQYIDGLPTAHGHESNDNVRNRVAVETSFGACVAIEIIEGYGLRVGKETFDTCEWIGRYSQVMEVKGREPIRVPRRAVKLHLCQNPTARDVDIRAAIIDRYGGKEKAIGSKRNPGPLYGITGDVWSALAVAITASAPA